MKLNSLFAAAVLVFTVDLLGAEPAVNKPVFQTSRTGEVYEVVAQLAATAPTLEAGFNDPAWKDARPEGAFRVVARTAFTTNQTLISFSAGTDSLYVAVACEDDDIQATPGERNSNVAWTMDAVEWFICPRRDNEQWFHFIFNAAGAQYNDIEGTKRDPKWQPAPDWQVATARQPWGWTAVARIPYAAMGLTEPAARGDVWKLKCIRTDLSKAGKIQSSWTRVAEAFDADSFSGGDLVFGSRNLLANPLEHWRPGEPIADWKVTAGKGAVEAVMADGEPAGLFHWERESDKVYAVNFGFGGRGGYKQAPYDGIFRFTAKARLRPTLKEHSVAYFRWYIGDEKPPYASVLITPSTDFREYELQHAFKRGQPIYAPELHTSGFGDIEIKDVVFKLDDRLVKKAGVHCLTKNAPPELARLNLDVGCRYTYRKAGTDADEFPYFTPHFGGPPSVVGFSDEGYTGSDGHRAGGWIPVKEGYLTDGLIGTGVGWGLYFYPSSGYDVVFDLGSDYLIDEVEIMAPGASIRNASLYLKSTNDVRYAMTHTIFDLPDFNRSGYDRRGSAKFAGVNAGARWIRMNLVLDYGGFSEVRIWGRPFKAGETQPAKIPYRQGGGKIVAENPKELPGLPEMTIFPLPQEIEQQKGNLLITPEINIVIAGAGNDRAQMTAEVLQEGIFTRTGLKLPIAMKSRSAAIVLKEDPSAIDKPEGYVLEATAKGVVIAGKDPVGTFYGAQSLVQLLQSDGKGGWQIPCQRIRDWPATPIRYVEGSQVINPALIRALARFKINYYSVNSSTVAKANRAMAEKYCVKLAPAVSLNWAWCAKPEEFSERAEGEDLAKLGAMRRNPCPSHPGMWEAYFKGMDEMIEACNSDILNINADEMYFPNMGSRWNVCPRCRARNLTGQDLFVETLKKIQAHASSRGKRFMMIDSIMNSKGISHPDDATNDWRKIPDLLPPEVKKDMIVYLWHATDPVYDALITNHITIIRWSPNAGFVEQQGFPGHYSGFFLSQADGAMDIGQIIGMAQLCWSPERARGGGKDEQRFLELAAAALPMWNECMLNNLPPSRQPGRKTFCVDLAGAANESRVDDVPGDGKGWVDLGSECDLSALLPGLRNFAGTPFNVIDEQKNGAKSVVMVANRGALDRVLPTRVEFPVNQKAASLCFLHTLSQRAGWNYHTKDELCGYYFIVYEDDTCDPFEIKYAINAVNWDGKNTIWTYSPRGIALSRAGLAWRGETRSGQTAALYAAEWINPRPQATIKKIIFASPQLKTSVKPILLAVTGFAALPDDADDASVDRKLRLRPAAVLSESKLPGAPIDLTEGKVESKRLYVTKDGIRLKTESPFMQFSEINENYQGAVACVAFDNNQAIKGLNQNAAVIVELPEPRMLSGVGVAGQYRYEFYQNDFLPAIIDYSVEISPDGTTWEKIADVKGHIPEEEGLRTHAFAPRLLKAVRITARNAPGSNHTNWAGGQLAFIQLYEPAESATRNQSGNTKKN